MDALSSAAFTARPPHRPIWEREAAAEAAAPADPVLAAISAHRAAYDAFQVAPDAEAPGAEEAEHEAAVALLGTACASVAGGRALLDHLGWYVAEEADNLLTAGLGGAVLGDLVRARLAELKLFLAANPAPDLPPTA